MGKGKGVMGKEGEQSPSTPPAASIEAEFDLHDVHDLSLGILADLEENEIDCAHGAAAAGMTFGRLLSDHVMEQDEEIAFLEALFEWGGVYFAGGTVQ